MNRVCLVGHLAVDPELRYTPNGTAVASFRIAVRDVFRKTENGQYAADFFDVEVWQQRAEFASNYLTKGSLVGVQGRLATREWTAQDGTKRRKFYIVGDQIESLARPAGQDGGSRQDAEVAPPTTARDEPAEYHVDPFADE
jgi:single-strand DNA-binding protein